MNRSRSGIRRILWAAVALPAALLGVYLLFTLGRPSPLPVKRQVFEGVTYQRVVRYLPHSMIAHVITIDTKNTRGLRFLVTPADPTLGGSVSARTTSGFLQEFDLQIAINGDGFKPWWSRSPADYYPHIGDPVVPNGFAASNGVVYSDGTQDPRPEPTLYVTRTGGLVFNRAPSRVFHAISGDRMLVVSGEVVGDLNAKALHPRTALGLNRNGRWLYLLVVDGRQPLYSAGVTLLELGKLLKDFGAYNAMALDGGGSSTLVIRSADGRPQVLNSPIDHYIPGTERPVANHLGIYLNP